MANGSPRMPYVTSVTRDGSGAEGVLRDIGRAGGEARRAVGEVEAPAAQEGVVEAARVQLRRCRIERREPALERVGVVEAERAHARERQSPQPCLGDEPAARGKHAAWKDVLLDEVRLRSISLEPVLGDGN